MIPFDTSTMDQELSLRFEVFGSKQDGPRSLRPSVKESQDLKDLKDSKDSRQRPCEGNICWLLQ